MVTTAGLADSATATTAESTVIDSGELVTRLDAGVVTTATAAGTAATPASTPTVTAEANVADRSEMASTPASQRPDTEREEDARGLVVDDSPARIAGAAATGENGATGTVSTGIDFGVNGSKVGSRSMSFMASLRRRCVRTS